MFGEGEQGGADAQAAGLGGAVAGEGFLEDPQRLAWREEGEGGGVGSGGAADAVPGVIGAQAHPVGFLGALGAQDKEEGGEEAAVIDGDAFGEGEAPEAAAQGLDHGVAVLAGGQEGVPADFDTEVNGETVEINRKDGALGACEAAGEMEAGLARVGNAEEKRCQGWRRGWG